MPLAFLDRFRRVAPAETPPGDHVAAPERLTDPDATPSATRPTPGPSRRSQRPDGSQQPQRPPHAPVPPRIWFTATLTAADQIREARILDHLAQLTTELDSPLAAARRLFTPDLEAPDA